MFLLLSVVGFGAFLAVFLFSALFNQEAFQGRQLDLLDCRSLKKLNLFPNKLCKACCHCLLLNNHYFFMVHGSADVCYSLCSSVLFYLYIIEHALILLHLSLLHMNFDDNYHDET